MRFTTAFATGDRDRRRSHCHHQEHDPHDDGHHECNSRRDGHGDGGGPGGHGHGPGGWRLERHGPTALAAGTYTVLASVRDAAGNAATATQALTVQVNPSMSRSASPATYSVLGGTGMSSTGITHVSGDLGVSPSNSVGGFPPGIVAAPSTPVTHRPPRPRPLSGPPTPRSTGRTPAPPSPVSTGGPSMPASITRPRHSR